jgi:hypothetical protein
MYDDTYVEMNVALNANGTYECLLRSTQNGRSSGWLEDIGAVAVQGNKLLFVPSQGTKKGVLLSRRFEMENDVLWVSFHEIGYMLSFRRY